MKPSISFYTLGCRLNQSETASIEQSFQSAKYKVVDFNDPADVVVINTCTVTENGDADTRRIVNKINRMNPDVRIALVGCQAQIQKKKLTELPNVKWVVGNANKMDFLSILDKGGLLDEPQVIAPTIPRHSFTIPIASVDTKHTRANIKIQDGCDFFCSFCEIPYARGRARSRKFNDILLEANTLVDAGHRELVITGINVGTYKQNQKTLLDVINALEQIDGLERIRISSIEPTTIPFALIKKMTKTSKLCRYLHIPLQSGEDHILQLMKRKYTLDEFQSFINQAYDMVPEICIGTDIIVGFPGETERVFKKGEEFLRESKINYFHVFSYSNRYMAKAQYFDSQINPGIISQRSQSLRNLSQRKRRMYYESLLNTEQKVLFEQFKDYRWSGLTDNYVRVEVESTDNLSNQIRNVRLQTISKVGILGCVC